MEKEINWIEIGSIQERDVLEDVLVLTDNREIHVGYFSAIDDFQQYSKEGWSGKITHFALLSEIRAVLNPQNDSKREPEECDHNYEIGSAIGKEVFVCKKCGDII